MVQLKCHIIEWDRPFAHMWVRKKGTYYMYFIKTICIFADSPNKTVDNVNGNIPIILDTVKKMRIYKSQVQVILEGTFKGQDTT